MYGTLKLFQLKADLIKATPVMIRVFLRTGFINVVNFFIEPWLEYELYQERLSLGIEYKCPLLYPMESSFVKNFLAVSFFLSFKKHPS